MHGIKIVSTFAALAAFAEAQQQFVMAAATQATCDAEHGTFVAAAGSAAAKCTPETAGATKIRKDACTQDPKFGTWNATTKACTDETADAKTKRECPISSTFVAAAGSDAAKCLTDEQLCVHQFGSWADGATVEVAGVCTAESDADQDVREFTCKQAFGSWSNKVCTDETADAKAVRECVAPSTWKAASGSGANAVAAHCAEETAVAKATRECGEAFGTYKAATTGANAVAASCTAETAAAKIKRECIAHETDSWENGACVVQTEAEAKEEACTEEFGTWAAATGTGASLVPASCTAETEAAKAQRECVSPSAWVAAVTGADAADAYCNANTQAACTAEFGTWAAATKVCTAETEAAKTIRVTKDTTACEGATATPTGKKYKAATGECFEANWHQKEMCSMPTVFPLEVAGEPFFVADDVNGNWCLDFTTEFSLDCEYGCSDWGETCVTEEFAHICEDNEFAATYGSSAGLIIGVLLGVLGAVAVGIVVYCLCCKKNDDDYQKA